MTFYAGILMACMIWFYYLSSVLAIAYLVMAISYALFTKEKQKQYRRNR